MSSSYFAGYAFGTVLTGFVLSSPAWLGATLWNKLFSHKRVNPWKLPFITSLVFFLLASMGSSHRKFGTDSEFWVVVLGLCPSVAWYGFRCYRYREASEELSL